MHGLKLIICSSKNFLKKKQIIKFNGSIWNCCVLSNSTLASKEVDLQLDFKNPIFKKIIYSEALKPSKQKKAPGNPDFLCLKYVFQENEQLPKNEAEKDNYEDTLYFPYEICKKFIVRPVIDRSVTNAFTDKINFATPSDNDTFNFSKPDVSAQTFEKSSKWVQESNLENDNIEDIFKFGSCDPDYPMSSVPCGGCGALLHCNDMSIPGFLPQEIFKEKTKKQLRSEICQRCHFLKEFNVALGVNVSSEEYPKIISQIHNKKALAIILVDLLDFPCSIWPDILELIGSRPVIIVGNKIDLFIQEGSWFLSHMKKCLITSLEETGMNLENVLHVALISAKTGFGIEELINKIHKFWSRKGDIFIVGCTNTGKSTLFNKFVMSDLCKVKAIDVLHKATVSTWPGTTLNFIKFPIMSPAKWKLFARTQRLIKMKKEKHAYEKLLKLKHNFRLEQMPLAGYVGRTFESVANLEGAKNVFQSDILSGSSEPKGLDVDDPAYEGKWCYDTPGVVNRDQIVNLLTTPELLLTVPKNMLLPRNFQLNPGLTLFIGGIARLDYLNGTGSAWFTVYASKELPITVTKIENADIVYEEFLGTQIFRVPVGGKERLAKWPKLSSKKFRVAGTTPNKACADIVLSSAGWVSIATRSAYICDVEAWTPEGKGIYLRKTPIIMTGHSFRGKKIGNTPAYRTEMVEVEVEPFALSETDK